MTQLDALRQAVLECQQFPYRAEQPGSDLWQSPKETEHYGNGDCEDAAVWTIARTWALVEGAELCLVAGVLAGGVGPAWVELVDGAETWWADPTPGWGALVHPPGWFQGRTPRFAYRWNGSLFLDKFAYTTPGRVS